MPTLTAPTLPLLLEEVKVRRVERLSPTFVRVALGSPALAEFGVEGQLYDQRIKLIFPPAGGSLGDFADADETWMTTWFEKPAEERGHMRTYTVRGVEGAGEDTELIVDFVLHADGEHGPGGDWAAQASVGDRLVTLAPKKGELFGGIEFVPGDAKRLLLVGDETAVPAIAAILEQLPASARGAAFIEVPVAGDVLALEHPDGVAVSWLSREGTPRGEALHAAVLAHLGEEAAGPAAVEVAEDEIDPDLWETPSYSSSGEELDGASRSVGHDYDGLYAWIAGESKLVTGLRRAMVRDLGVERHQVAFMGYWREGVAMKS